MGISDGYLNLSKDVQVSAAGAVSLKVMEFAGVSDGERWSGSQPSIHINSHD